MKSIILLLLLFVVFIKFFSYELTKIYFKKFHKEICIQNECINNVKDWIPIFVKNNNNNYFFDLINEKYIPLKLNRSSLKRFTNGIILEKNKRIVKIIFDKEAFSSKKNSILKRYVYKNKVYFVQDLIINFRVFYPQKNLYIELSKDEETFLKAFLNQN